MIQVKLLFFATLRDKAGTRQAVVELPEGITVSSLKTHLAEMYPDTRPFLENSLVAIDKEFAFPEDTIPSGAEVALFPPVSGGGAFPTIVKIVSEPLDQEELLRQLAGETTGAVCLFTGLVRKITEREGAREVSHLEYEAYIPMAEAKMTQVANEIRQRWPMIEGIAIVQRIGRLETGTPTILIACAAAHRDTGVFEAARYGIDRLKEIVPIWKKEVGPQGKVWVEGSYMPKPGD